MMWSRLEKKKCPQCGGKLWGVGLKGGFGYECRTRSHIFQITQQRLEKLLREIKSNG